MSLILEALRKSEAERRRGQPPDLLHELPPASGAKRGRVPAWSWAVAAVVGIALLWWLWQAPENTPQTAAPAEDAGDTNAQRQVAPAAQPSPAPAADLPAPSPVAGPAPPAPSPAIAAPSAPLPEVAMAPAATPDPSASTAPSPTRAVSAPAAAPTATRDAAPPSTGGVTALNDLDPSTREALPALKLSMHMWNEEPARRFAILDGRRVVEGDRIGEATVTRIEPDGVLLEWHGSRVRVPLR